MSTSTGHSSHSMMMMLFFPLMLPFFFMLLCCCVAYFRPYSTLRYQPQFKISTYDDNLCNFHSSSYNNDKKKALMVFINKIITIPTLTLLLTTFIYPEKSIAIGDLSEFKQQNIVLQDVSLNVPTNVADGELLKALFVNKFQTLRSSPSLEEIVLGFGPDTYTQPKSFVPGVSSFQEYGGHATVTLISKSLPDNTLEVFERGNGLQYIKIGAEDIRLSKAIEKGALIKYAYGWVDLDTTGNVPVEVVVGSTRDPVMLASIRVRDMAESVKFLTDQLGMRVLPFPICRPPGSNFEPLPPKGSVYLGYSEDTFGILLTPTIKGDPPLRVGSQLNGFTIVVDDSSDEIVKGYPSAISSVLSSSGEGAKEDQLKIKSPDGYTFIIKPYSQFKKESTSNVQFD